MNRDTTLDYLRGLAIMSIVIGHLYYFSGRASGSVVWNICNTIQIPIFIYVSGVLAHKSIKKYSFTDFLYSRFVRLIFPFVSFFIIWLLYKGISIDNAIIFVSDEFKQGYWFLLVLFELMIILAINHLIAKRTKIDNYILDTLFLIIINIYHFFISEFETFDKFFSINLLWHYYPIFLIGIYSNKLQQFFYKRVSILYSTMYMGAFYLMYYQNINLMTALCNITSLFFFVSTLSNVRYKLIEIALIRMGSYSLQIYLLHLLLFILFQNYIPIIYNRWIEVICYIVLASILSSVIILASYLLMKCKTIKLFLFGIR